MGTSESRYDDKNPANYSKFSVICRNAQTQNEMHTHFILVAHWTQLHEYALSFISCPRSLYSLHFYRIPIRTRTSDDPHKPLLENTYNGMFPSLETLIIINSFSSISMAQERSRDRYI